MGISSSRACSGDFGQVVPSTSHKLSENEAEVTKFLEDSGLHQYAATAIAAGYDDMSTLSAITLEDLGDIELFCKVTIPPGHKKKFLIAVRNLLSERSPSVSCNTSVDNVCHTQQASILQLSADNKHDMEQSCGEDLFVTVASNLFIGHAALSDTCEAGSSTDKIAFCESTLDAYQSPVKHLSRDEFGSNRTVIQPVAQPINQPVIQPVSTITIERENLSLNTINKSERDCTAGRLLCENDGLEDWKPFTFDQELSGSQAPAAVSENKIPEDCPITYKECDILGESKTNIVKANRTQNVDEKNSEAEENEAKTVEVTSNPSKEIEATNKHNAKTDKNDPLSMVANPLFLKTDNRQKRPKAAFPSAAEILARADMNTQTELETVMDTSTADVPKPMIQLQNLPDVRSPSPEQSPAERVTKLMQSYRNFRKEKKNKQTLASKDARMQPDIAEKSDESRGFVDGINEKHTPASDEKTTHSTVREVSGNVRSGPSSRVVSIPAFHSSVRRGSGPEENTSTASKITTKPVDRSHLDETSSPVNPTRCTQNGKQGKLKMSMVSVSSKTDDRATCDQLAAVHNKSSEECESDIFSRKHSESESDLAEQVKPVSALRPKLVSCEESSSHPRDESSYVCPHEDTSSSYVCDSNVARSAWELKSTRPDVGLDEMPLKTLQGQTPLRRVSFSRRTHERLPPAANSSVEQAVERRSVQDSACRISTEVVEETKTENQEVGTRGDGDGDAKMATTKVNPSYGRSARIVQPRTSQRLSDVRKFDMRLVDVQVRQKVDLIWHQLRESGELEGLVKELRWLSCHAEAIKAKEINASIRKSICVLEQRQAL